MLFCIDQRETACHPSPDRGQKTFQPYPHQRARLAELYDIAIERNADGVKPLEKPQMQTSGPVAG
jgi:hypothetical protein